MNLEELGITKEDLQERIVERVSDAFTNKYVFDDGDYRSTSELAKMLDDKIRERIDDAISELAEKHVLPHVSAYVETIPLQKTNYWGEPQGEPMSFREYLVSQAEKYMNEKVDYRGERTQYTSDKKQTRIAHMIHHHLHYQIEMAIKSAIQNANNILTTGIEETVKMKLNEISEKLNINVKAR